MNETATSATALPLLPYALRVADTLIPPLPAGHPLAQLHLAPETPAYPFYRLTRDSLWPAMSDKYLSLAAPVLVYWAYSMVYELVDRLQWPFFEQYRIHEPEEVKARNKVSKRQVVKMVAFQQLVQTILGIIVLESEDVIHAQITMDHTAGVATAGAYLTRVLARLLGTERASTVVHAHGTTAAWWLYWWIIPTAQFWWAFFVMDTWQYFWHRAAHESRFLYRHFHSHHHRLYVPYAFGALYNHPVEGLVLDSLGAAVSYALSVMTVRQGILLFFFSTLKTVDDHGGYAFPWWIDPLHILFPNTAEYHDIHHQMQGLRYNYSQPFFIHFDVLLGTRMDARRLAKMREQAAKKTWKQDLRKQEQEQQQQQQLASVPPQQVDSKATSSAVEAVAATASTTSAQRSVSATPFAASSRHTRTTSSGSAAKLGHASASGLPHLVST